MRTMLRFRFVFIVLAFILSTASMTTVYSQTKPSVASPVSTETAAQMAKVSTLTPSAVPTRVAGIMTAKSSSQSGGDRLQAMQYTDGGWGWPLTAPPTYGNILGPIAMGLAQAYQQTGDAGMLTDLTDAGTFLLSKTNNFSPSDGYLAAELDRLLGVTTYTTHVTTNFYGPLAAGTYDRNGLGTLYSTASYVNLIRTSRSGSQANLAAWDIGMGLVGAAECGAGTAAWIAGVKAEIDELANGADYDVIGLAGAVYGLAFVGENFDPTAGSHAAASSLADLAAILASYQIAGGGLTWNATLVNPGEETIQETGYSILALNEVNRATYLTAIQGAADYMMSVQLGNGGWENYPTGGENNEVTAEALWGISAAYPPPVHNVTKNVYYPTIQAAVAGASSGNAIDAAAGTYLSAGTTITIDKALTLTGAGEGISFIDVSSNGLAWGIHIKSSNVTMSGFTVLPVLGPTPNGYPIHVAPEPATPGSQISNINLNHITVNGSRRTGIDLHGVDNASLSYLTSTNATNGNGVQLTGVVGATLTHITTSGNAWGGVAVYNSGPTLMNRGSDNISLDLTTSSISEVNKFYSQAEFSLPITNITATGFGYKVRNNATAGSAVYIWYQVLQGDAVAFALALPSPTFSSVQVIADGSWYVGVGMTIQAAINAASAGDLVNIAAGTFTQNVDLSKRLSIVGAGSSPSGTIVTKTGGSNGVVNLLASGISTGNPVLLKNLRVQPVGVAGISVGTFTGSTGTIVSYVKLENVNVVGTNATPCTEQERGLYVDLTSSLTNLEIVGGAFDNLHYGWYLHKVVSADASTVSDVSVTGTSFRQNSWKGIYAEKLENATFTGCTVDQNGVYAASMSPCSYFIPFMAGVDINLKAGMYQDLNFINCTFTNNGLGTNGGVGTAREGSGLALKARGTGSDPSYVAFPATLDDVEVTGGSYTGNERGIRIGEPGKSNTSPTNVEIHGAIISGNVKTYPGVDGSAYGGVVNLATPITDATYNYWGTLHGPSDPIGTIEVPKNPIPSVANAKNALPAPNLGNAVTESVEYFPWTGPASGHANGGIWAGGYVNPVANEIFMGIDAAALDVVDPYDTVAPPPPPSDYLYLYLLLDPGQPIENYSVDVKKDEPSLITNAKGWDLRAVTDHTSSTVNLVLPFSGLPSGFKATLYDLTTNDYANLSDNPAYSYTSPASITPSAFRVLIGDSTKPTVAVSTPNGGEYLVVGTPYNITWTSSDATGVLRHYIYYSLTGGAPYTLIDSTNGATFIKSWTPLSAAATASIKVTARDSVMNEETDISNSTFTILASNSISFNALAGWNLLSVPMLQGVMTPAAVFGDDYAVPYYTYRFSPSSGYSVPATLNMGQGYWLGSNSAQLIDAVGTPLSSASLGLDSGFNIIGNPFATDMDVADLAFTDGFNTYDIAGAATAGWLSNVLYGYNGTSYYIESSTLEYWRGYWVPMLVAGVSAEYTPTVVTPTPKIVPIVENRDPNAWGVELGAVLTTDAGVKVGDAIAAFGVRSDASASFSPRYDAPRPPRSPSENFIEVSIGGSDDAFRSLFGDAAYARKFLPADRAGWEIVVRTSAPGEVTLRWDNAAIAALPAGVKVDLYDAVTRRSVDMKNASSYTYNQTGDEQRFNVNRPSGVAATPVAWELSQNYPNPFNPTTTINYGLPSAAAVSIEVFNFIGQRVATLLSGDIVQSAGYHEVVFNAANLASGFYYYTLTATTEDGARFNDVRKMILMK